MGCKPKPDVKHYVSKPQEVTAFRWDGREVEGFERVSGGVDNDGNLVWNLVVNPFSDEKAYASLGDYVVTAAWIDRVFTAEEFARAFVAVLQAESRGIQIDSTSVLATSD